MPRKSKKLRHGFRTEAEEYAEDFRSELGLERHEPLKPQCLCDHLCIPVHGISDFPGIDAETRAHFAGDGASCFSATTLAINTRRIILHNDYQHPNRQASNIMHEAAHIILGHPPRAPMMDDGCRNYDPILELEANELGFVLLVPRFAALHAVEAIRDIRLAANYYGVSESLLRYRVRISNAVGWARNRSMKRTA